MTDHPNEIERPISIRAYVPTIEDDDKRGSAPSPRKVSKDRKQSLWTLVLDTETRTSADQDLRFGSYQLRNEGKLVEEGIFYSPKMPATEVDLLNRFAASKGMKSMLVADFIERVFFGIAYEMRAAIVGFNLPFDLSRLAIAHGSARGKAMKGGFTFKFAPEPWRPHVQVRHLSARSALTQFTQPFRKEEIKREQRSGLRRPVKRGAFIDVKTIAAALLSQHSLSLQSLCALIKVETRKISTDEHGQALTEDYIRYAVQDVQATWECYACLADRFDQHRLGGASLSKILSEASLGKAYLAAMGIRPHRVVQPKVPPSRYGIIMSSYYGGRTEVRWRRKIRQVAYCDFMSMYPTVCTLQGLWRFIIADKMIWRRALDEARAILSSVTAQDLQDKAFWPKLAMLVQVKPSKSLLPVRAPYQGKGNSTIGLNFLTSKEPLWYTLADLIAGKLLAGEVPEVLDAIAFEPGTPQAGLTPIRIMGRQGYDIDPYKGDFFKSVIDLRATVKKQWVEATGTDRDLLDAEQLALKILANSTGYGIYMEVIVSTLDRAEMRECHGPSGEPGIVDARANEDLGKYFHPLLGTLITGAARLMLAAAEHQVVNQGLDWAFCDTDSLAIVRPDGMDEAEFNQRVSRVQGYFDSLYPYDTPGTLLKLEDANFRPGTKILHPLYCLCISAKRYVMFNMDDNGRPIIRKASAHGLGHLVAPYGKDDSRAGLPSPLPKIGVRRWQHDLWYQIIMAHLEGHPDRVDLTYHPALSQPAASRYSATTPELLRWFRKYNEGRPYHEQVRPFGFMLVFQAKPDDVLSEYIGKRPRGRPKKNRDLKPIACFDKDPTIAAQHAFDRENGQPIHTDKLKSYAEALRGYHLSPEAKFRNGGPFDSGRTERRHVIASDVHFIGKESNRWEEAQFLGTDHDVFYKLLQRTGSEAAD